MIPFAKKQYRYFDVYDRQGNLLQKSAKFSQKSKNNYCFFLTNSDRERFFLIDKDSEYLDEQDLSCVIYQYKLKESFK